MDNVGYGTRLHALSAYFWYDHDKQQALTATRWATHPEINLCRTRRARKGHEMEVGARHSAIGMVSPEVVYYGVAEGAQASGPEEANELAEVWPHSSTLDHKAHSHTP